MIPNKSRVRERARLSLCISRRSEAIVSSGHRAESGEMQADWEPNTCTKTNFRPHRIGFES